jgi:hypothetical protein
MNSLVSVMAGAKKAQLKIVSEWMVSEYFTSNTMLLGTFALTFSIVSLSDYTRQFVSSIKSQWIGGDSSSFYSEESYVSIQMYTRDFHLF